MTPHFLVLAGETRFRVLERFARPGWVSFTLREVVSHDILTPHGVAIASDGGRGGSLGSSVFPHATTDDHRHRAIEWFAEHIERFLLARPGQAWAFAACPRLCRPILEGLRPSLRGSLVELVQQDLSSLPGSEVLGFFKSRF